jgi:mono/diheme cytochrome c family protein
VRPLAPALLVLALGACEGPPAGAPRKVDARELYVQNCARCHGLDGKGEPQARMTLPNLPDLTSAAWQAKVTSEQMERSVMTGKGMMPPWGAVLSRPKISAVVAYVRHLPDEAAPK